MQRLLSKREAAEYTHYHPEHLMRLSRAGRFPRAIKLGASANCAVRFLADEIDAWLAERIAARKAHAAPKS